MSDDYLINEFKEKRPGVEGLLDDTSYIAGTESIPRAFMPQIPQVAYERFLTYLKSKKVGVEYIDDFAIGRIKPTQEDIDLGKVKEMIATMDGASASEFTNAFIISKEDNILDGHHRFVAMQYSGKYPTVPVVKVNLGIRELISLAHMFSSDATNSDLYESQVLLNIEETAIFAEVRSKWLYLRKISNNIGKLDICQRNMLNGAYSEWSRALSLAAKSIEPYRLKEFLDVCME